MQYRVIKKVFQPFDNWNPVSLYFLQVRNNEFWYTLVASSFLADIKHACFEGRNHDEKLQAYQEFLNGNTN